MTFRVKIISPIKVDDADLRRRRMRYGEHAGPDTDIQMFNLLEGPTTLDTPGDILFCEHAVFQVGMNTDPDDFDAILIDCAFDPAVDALQEQCSVPTFGPMKATLALVGLVTDRFSFIARAPRQIEWLVAVAHKYGYGEQIASARALGISYQESRTPKTFDTAMIKQMNGAVNEDGAQAIVMGSTTMALAENVVAAASGKPLFMPGMVALRVLKHLWADGLLAQGA